MKKIFSAFVIIALLSSARVVLATTIEELQLQIQQLILQIQRLQSQNVLATTNTCLSLSNTLRYGNKDTTTNGDVTRLQQFLATDVTIYPEQQITGYFGLLTERAVKKWQETNGVVSSGTPESTGFGVIGPKTREKLSVKSGCHESFKTNSAHPFFIIKSPQQNQVYAHGEIMKIAWMTSAENATDFNLELIDRQGSSVQQILSNKEDQFIHKSSANVDYWFRIWRVPDEISDGNYRIRITCDAANTTSCGTGLSDEFAVRFRQIENPYSIEISRFSGDTFQLDESGRFEFEAFNKGSTTVLDAKVEFYLQQGSVKTNQKVAFSFTDSATYYSTHQWPIHENPPAGWPDNAKGFTPGVQNFGFSFNFLSGLDYAFIPGQAALIVQLKSGAQILVEKKIPFTIIAPTHKAEVSSGHPYMRFPYTPAIWNKGDMTTAGWNWGGDTKSMNVELLSTNNPGFLRSFGKNLDVFTSGLTFMAPKDVPEGAYLWRACDADNANDCAISDPFLIVENYFAIPTLILRSPQGNDHWKTGSNQIIYWTWSGNTTKITVQLKKIGEQIKFLVGTYNSSDSPLRFRLPLALSPGDYIIEICTSPSFYGLSICTQSFRAFVIE